MSARTPLVFIGASAGLREILQIVRDRNAVDDRYDVIAALDDDERLHDREVAGVRVAGGLARARDYQDARFVLCIGSFRGRLARHLALAATGVAADRFETLVHPRSTVYPDATLGPGCIVHAGSSITAGCALGAFAIVAFNSVLAPGCRVGRYGMITTSVTVLSGAEIGPAAFIGAASCVGEGVRVGPGAMIGMGSVVFRDVRPGAFVLGNPARELYRVTVPTELLDGWAARAIPKEEVNS